MKNLTSTLRRIAFRFAFGFLPNLLAAIILFAYVPVKDHLYLVLALILNMYMTGYFISILLEHWTDPTKYEADQRFKELRNVIRSGVLTTEDQPIDEKKFYTVMQIICLAYSNKKIDITYAHIMQERFIDQVDPELGEAMTKQREEMLEHIRPHNEDNTKSEIDL